MAKTRGKAVEIAAADIELQELEEARIYLLRDDPHRIVLRMMGSGTTVNFLMTPAALAHLAADLSIDSELLLTGKLRTAPQTKR